jgi:hypothetical protein
VVAAVVTMEAVVEVLTTPATAVLPTTKETLTTWTMALLPVVKIKAALLQVLIRGPIKITWVHHLPTYMPKTLMPLNLFSSITGAILIMPPWNRALFLLHSSQQKCYHPQLRWTDW